LLNKNLDIIVADRVMAIVWR